MTGFHLPPISDKQWVTGHPFSGSGVKGPLFMTISQYND